MTISKELRLRPVVAFDVDGVLRVQRHRPIPEGFFAVDERPEQDLFSAEITLEEGEYPALFHGKPHWDEQGKSFGTEYFSVAGAELIRSISEGSIADAVWATTWQRWANTYFAEHLGIPELPVAVETLEPLERNWVRSSPAWKTMQLARQFDGRPLIWLDDNMPDRPQYDLTEQRRPVDRALTLSYRVNPATGITPEDILIINSWLELASSKSGQLKLRALRAQEMRDERLRWAKDQRRRDREHAIYVRTLDLALELFPGQDYFARDLASIAKSRIGLTIENIGYALKRHSVKDADPEVIFSKLRVRGYHRRVDLDSDFFEEDE